MIRKESRGNIISMNVTSLIGYEHFVEGVFQRRHFSNNLDHGIKTFFYEIDLFNFLLENVEKELNSN